MSILSPSRCVLLLTDEGLGIYDTGGNRVQLLDSLPWETEDFADAVSEIIRKRSKSKSIVILNDMVEQHYRKERVPKVSSLDRANILKHRVSAAFPAYPMRSSLKLKEKPAARDNDSTGGDVYLFAAVPQSENIRKVLDGVRSSYLSLAGLCLLPVKSSSMVHALSRKISKSPEGKNTWTVFIGQHRNGGLRQIVTKNGELALTRMTPFLESDSDGDVWATEIISELKGTMSYLSRFGFDQRDGLEVIMIANNAVADKVVSRVDFECNLNVLTAIEAANLLGLKIGLQTDQRYADPLHVAWTGKKTALALSLQAPEIDNISNPAKMAMLATVVLFAGCCYFAYDAYSSLNAWTKTRGDITGAEQTLASVKQEHEIENERQKSVGIDFPLIKSSTAIFSGLEKRAMKPLPVIAAIGQSLGPDVRISSMIVKPYDPTAAALVGGLTAQTPAVDPNAPAEAEGEKPQEYEVIISMKFPATLAPELGVQKVSEIQARLQGNLPGYTISVIKQVADLTYTGNFVGEASSQSAGDPQAKEDYEAQIMIKGAML